MIVNGTAQCDGFTFSGEIEIRELPKRDGSLCRMHFPLDLPPLDRMASQVFKSGLDARDALTAGTVRWL